MVPAVILSVIACIVLLLVLFLSSRARVEIKGIDTDLTVSIRYLFIRYTLFPAQKKAKDYVEDYLEDKDKREKEGLTLSTPETEAEKKPKKKRDILGLIRFVTRILKMLHAKYPRCFHIRLKRLILVIGGSDAARTAMHYGAVRSAAAYLLTFCENFVTFRTPRNAVLLIEPNYLTNESIWDIDMDLSVSVFTALRLILKVTPQYFRYRKDAKNKRARTASPTPVNNDSRES